MNISVLQQIEVEKKISKVASAQAIHLAYQYLSKNNTSGGLQSSIALDEQFQNSLSLNTIVRQEFPEAMDKRLQKFWSQEVIPILRNKLGCALARENFTEMLALKLLRSNVQMIPNLDITGLHHYWIRNVLDKGLLNSECWRFLFFNTRNFAADADCTGVALTGLYDTGGISDDELIKGVRELLSSAGVKNLSVDANKLQNKGNQGSLMENVFKTYFEDQKFVDYQKNGSIDKQSGAAFRGCKHDPVVVVNAILPILKALKTKKLRLDETVQLNEYAEQGCFTIEEFPRYTSRENQVTVGNIIDANWRYIANHLPEVENGTRYYPYPETFLCFLSELLWAFPRETTKGINSELFREKIVDSLETVCDPQSPLQRNSLRLAQLIIAADNYNTSVFIGNKIPLKPIQNAKKLVLNSMKSDGSWAAAPLYTLGTNKKIYFGSAAISTIFAIRALEGN
jgi:hypothetical protein